MQHIITYRPDHHHATDWRDDDFRSLCGVIEAGEPGSDEENPMTVLRVMQELRWAPIFIKILFPFQGCLARFESIPDLRAPCI